MPKIAVEPLALFAGMLLVVLTVVSARAGDISVEQGKALFSQKCSPCHSIGGGDRPSGPDLAGVTTRADQEWLEHFIQSPGKVLSSGDPTATKLLKKFKNLRMPDLGLSESEVKSVLGYLATTGESSKAEAQAARPAPKAEAGDAQKGEALFVGSLSFVRGGAPCLACHGISGAGLGLAAGASYGPDLTSLWEAYGADGVASILESLPFPSMAPIFAKRPLTTSERADLSAFFRRVNGRRPAQIGETLVWQVAAGVVILLILAAIFGRGRLRTVRRSLVAQAKSRKGEAR
jgi:mono/diheme cytochrome c family protein